MKQRQSSNIPPNYEPNLRRPSRHQVSNFSITINMPRSNNTRFLWEFRSAEFLRPWVFCQWPLSTNTSLDCYYHLLTMQHNAHSPWRTPASDYAKPQHNLQHTISMVNLHEEPNWYARGPPSPTASSVSSCASRSATPTHPTTNNPWSHIMAASNSSTRPCAAMTCFDRIERASDSDFRKTLYNSLQ